MNIRSLESSPNAADQDSMETVRLSRRERDKLRQREQMLEAALDLFSERGYHNVSMHEIAERAEFAIGTLYSVFTNKEDLYKALLIDLSDRFGAELREALDQGEDEMERIQNYIRAKRAIWQENAKVIRLYFAETRGASFNIKAGLNAELRKRYEEFLSRLAEVFASGIRARMFRDLPPYDLAVALDSLLNSALLLWMNDPERHPCSERVATMVSIFFDPVKIE